MTDLTEGWGRSQVATRSIPFGRMYMVSRAPDHVSREARVRDPQCRLHVETGQTD